MLNFDYPQLLELFPKYCDPQRTESAAFLIWYLEKYYRLDPDEAIDCVCDQNGDKGIDGIYVNDDDNTITVFQSKISQKKDRTIGDDSLRTFAGTLRQFNTVKDMEVLLENAGKAQVASLIKRLDIPNKLEDYEIRGEFISNVDIDENGRNYLRTAKEITFKGRSTLTSTYISDEREIPHRESVSFNVFGQDFVEFDVDSSTKAIVAPIKAIELVKLDGIANQSLFANNVRGPLGKTKVNKDIKASVREKNSHKYFPLFHNGITMIVDDMEINDSKDTLTVHDYFVVNGCQSLTTLYDNKEYLTDHLRILTKFIKIQKNSSWSEKITLFSNNQNAVKARDFMANNAMQIRLQNDFKINYPNQYHFEIQRGEASGDSQIIPNEIAGLYLMAFHLMEPWGTHRRYQVFTDKHADIFGGPEITADRIVLCHIIKQTVEESIKTIKNTLVSKYILTSYFLMYLIRRILDEDSLAKSKIANAPDYFVRDLDDREHFKNCILKILDCLITDLNLELDEYGTDFDYRDKLRDSDWVKSLAKALISTHLKLIAHEREPSFQSMWENRTA